MAVINRALERLQGLIWGDGSKDSSFYLDNHAFYVDLVGRDAGSPGFVVRGLDPRTNAPTVLLQLDKDGVLAPSTLNPLVNPGLEIWQRGAGAFTANNAYAADRWALSVNGTSTLSVSRDTANVDAGSLYCAACTHVNGNATNLLFQVLEDFHQFAGRRLTFAARVKTSTAGAVRLSIFDGTTRTTGAYHTGSGQYETLQVMVNVPLTASSLQVEVGFLNASATAYVDNATLTVGQAAMAYVPMHPADDLARCMRYYEVFGGIASARYGIGQVATTTSFLVPLLYRVRKAVAPTVTVSGATSMLVTNAATGTIALTGLTPANATIDTAQVSGTVASGLVAGNACLLLNDATTTGIISVEANP